MFVCFFFHLSLPTSLLGRKTASLTVYVACARSHSLEVARLGSVPRKLPRLFTTCYYSSLWLQRVVGTWKKGLHHDLCAAGNGEPEETVFAKSSFHLTALFLHPLCTLASDRDGPLAALRSLQPSSCSGYFLCIGRLSLFDRLPSAHSLTCQVIVGAAIVSDTARVWVYWDKQTCPLAPGADRLEGRWTYKQAQNGQDLSMMGYVDEKGERKEKNNLPVP